MERPGQIGRYQLLSEVGRGGVGVVYKALDPEGRRVALKLLLAGKGASAAQRRRVATEIQTLLRLRHPNVVALLDAGEHQGAPYLVMEWVEGETLADRLRREGPLDPRLAAALVERLAGALAHCHAQGVLHRDLKPENVLMGASDGVPLLTDFGLSKDLASDSQASLSSTRAGLWLGTPGYWPPEQARGDSSAIGPRSDVYGLGALLFAALTGLPPQEGATLQELISALERDPTRPGARRQGIPPWLDAVCTRALALDPARRQSSAEELRRELAAGLVGARAAGGASSWSTRRRVVALLALLSLGAGTSLLGLRGSSPAAPDSQPPPLEVAEPDVEAINERGITSARQGLYREAIADYDRALALDPTLARVHFNRGLAHVGLGDTQAAIADFDQAITFDPALAVAWSHRATAHQRLGHFDQALADFDQAIALDPTLALAYQNRGALRGKLGLEGALEDYDRAIALDPTMPQTHFNRGMLRAKLGLVEGALEDYDRAIALDASGVQAYVNRGVLRAQLGRLPEAMADYDRAIELDPRLPHGYHNRARGHSALGEWELALADYDRAIELDPGLASAYVNRSVACMKLDRDREALESCTRAIALEPRYALAYFNRGSARKKLGQLREAVADFDRAIELEGGADWAAKARDLRAQALEED